MLSKDRIIAFEAVAVEWIPPMSAAVNVLSGLRVSPIRIQWIVGIPICDIPTKCLPGKVLVFRYRARLSGLLGSFGRTTAKLAIGRLLFLAGGRHRPCERSIEWTRIRLGLLCPQLDFDGQDFAGAELNVLASEALVAFSQHIETISAPVEIGDAEDSVSIGGRLQNPAIDSTQHYSAAADAARILLVGDEAIDSTARDQALPRQASLRLLSDGLRRRLSGGDDSPQRGADQKPQNWGEPENVVPSGILEWFLVPHPGNALQPGTAAEAISLRRACGDQTNFKK